jgi:hypothetical protein
LSTKDKKAKGKKAKVKKTKGKKATGKKATGKMATAKETNDKEYDERLRLRLGLLKEEMAAGRVIFASGIAPGIEKSLRAVRFGKDGKIDLATVDGRVRSLALAVEAGKYRQEIKGVASTRELQETYFDYVSSTFGGLHKDMLEAKATPHQVARALSKEPQTVENLRKDIPKFLESVQHFWEQAHDVARVHVEDMGGFKAVFGGELFPTTSHSLASTCGVYVDTIVLPEPFSRSEIMLTEGKEEQRAYWFVKQVLSLLNYKTLAVADVDTPIIALVPDAYRFDEDAAKQLARISEPDAVTHLNLLFGREFQALDEAAEFLQAFESPGEVVAVLRDRSRFLFQDGATEPLEQQLQEYIDEFTSLKGITHAGEATLAKVVGRMRQANDLLIRSGSLLGSPLIDAQVSWQYFNWKLQYDVSRIDPQDNLNLHLIRGLQSAAKTEMAWLGNVSSEALIEMRKVGALPELREILSRGVAEIAAARPDNFFRTGDKVVENIQAAFEEHRRKLDELRGKKWRFAGVELGACVVRGVMEVAAACGVPGVSLAKTALDQVIEVPKLRQLPGKFRAVRDESRGLHNSPVGILFKQSRTR